MLAKWTCPYCKFENKQQFEPRNDLLLTRCDSEEGGCDGLVVVNTEINLSVIPLKVEGEDARPE